MQKLKRPTLGFKPSAGETSFGTVTQKIIQVHNKYELAQRLNNEMFVHANTRIVLSDGLSREQGKTQFCLARLLSVLRPQDPVSRR